MHVSLFSFCHAVFDLLQCLLCNVILAKRMPVLTGAHISFPVTWVAHQLSIHPPASSPPDTPGPVFGETSFLSPGACTPTENGWLLSDYDPALGVGKRLASLCHPLRCSGGANWSRSSSVLSACRCKEIYLSPHMGTQMSARILDAWRGHRLKWETKEIFCQSWKGNV